MSAFTTHLFTRILPPQELTGSRQIYELQQRLIYCSELLGVIEVPAGLKTDFASIPRLAWRYIDPEDPAILYPSVIHDYLYLRGGLLPNGVGYTREQADRVLREAMDICGARIDQRAVVYRMVRLFGASHFNPIQS